MELAMDLHARIKHYDEYYASDGKTLCRTPNMTQMATYRSWVRDHNWLTEKSSYSLLYSHYDAPGCVKLFTFDTIASIIDFLKLSCPNSKDDKWFRDWYPNGLQVYVNHSNSDSELMMDSIANTSEMENKVPEVKHDKFLLVANFIFEMNRIVKAA
jgi:hypothetical protein